MKPKTVKLPEEMLQWIDKYIKDKPLLGYTSSADFLRGLVRKAMDEEEKK